jgi:hypothetical protein
MGLFKLKICLFICLCISHAQITNEGLGEEKHMQIFEDDNDYCSYDTTNLIFLIRPKYVKSFTLRWFARLMRYGKSKLLIL